MTKDKHLCCNSSARASNSQLIRNSSFNKKHMVFKKFAAFRDATLLLFVPFAGDVSERDLNKEGCAGEALGAS